MPVYIGLPCYDCGMFQVIQKPKGNRPKFTCRICGAKQSVKRVAAMSERAADVRVAVQRLNLQRGESETRNTDAVLAESMGVATESISSVQTVPLTIEDAVQQARQDEQAELDKDPLGSYNDFRKRAVRSQWAEFLPESHQPGAHQHSLGELGIDSRGSEGEDAGDDEDGDELFVLALPDPGARDSRKRARSTTGEGTEARTVRARNSRMSSSAYAAESLSENGKRARGMVAAAADYRGARDSIARTSGRTGHAPCRDGEDGFFSGNASANVDPAEEFDDALFVTSLD